MNKEEIAYTAGIFDGEGCVDIYTQTKSKNSKSPSLIVRVDIAQKDGRLMAWLVQHWGGYVQISKGRTMHHWNLRSKTATNFLKLIYPFLVVKKEQVALAIAFNEKKSDYLNTLKGSNKFRKLSDEEIEERQIMKEQMKLLKKKVFLYANDGTPTTTERKDS